MVISVTGPGRRRRAGAGRRAPHRPDPHRARGRRPRADRRGGRGGAGRRGAGHLDRRPRAGRPPRRRDRAALAAADLVDPTGRVRVERIGPDGAPADEGEVRALRVAAGGTDLARLVCVRRDGQIGEDDVHALERAATVAALLITREASITAVENKYQGDFLRELFAQPRPRRGVRRGARGRVRLGPRAGRRWSSSAELDPADEPWSRRATSAGGARSGSPSAWRQVTQTIEPGIPSVDFSSEVVALLPLSDDDGGRPGVATVTPRGGRGRRRQGRRPPVVLRRGRAGPRPARRPARPLRPGPPGGRGRAARQRGRRRRRSSTSSGCTG